VVAGAACRGRHHPRETKAAEVQLIDERVNDANRVVLTCEVIQALRQQRDLLSILALDVSRRTGACARYAYELQTLRAGSVRGLSHTLDPLRPVSQQGWMTASPVDRSVAFARTATDPP
jgi:hypothetical protein